MLVAQIHESFGNRNATVNISNGSIQGFTFDGVSFAGVRVDDDGVLFLIEEDFSLTAVASEWMVGGSDPVTDAASFFVIAIDNDASLDNNDMTTRIVCSTGNLDAWVGQAVQGTASGNVTLEFYDAVSGGNLLATGTFALLATNFGPRF